MGFGINAKPEAKTASAPAGGGRFDYGKAVSRGTLTISLSKMRRTGGRAKTGAMDDGGTRWQTFGNGGSYAPSIDIIGRTYPKMSDLEAGVTALGNLPLDDDHLTGEKDDAVHGGQPAHWRRWTFFGDNPADQIKVTLYVTDDTAGIKRVTFTK